MTTEPRDEARPLLTAAGCRNTILVVVALAVVGAAWWVRAGGAAPGASFLVSLVGATSFGILLVTAYAMVVNARAILDWFVVRHPPVVEHPVLGTLHYAGMRWRAEGAAVPCGMAGRRRGPDPELVAALSHPVANLAAFEERGRAFARAAVPEGEPIGATLWIEAARAWRSDAVVTYFDLALTGGFEDFVRVEFRGDEPIEAERSQAAVGGQVHVA